MLLIGGLEADDCLRQLPEFLPALNCSLGFSFIVTRWLLWLHPSPPGSREKGMRGGAAFPFPPYFSSQTSAQVSLARLWTLLATGNSPKMGLSLFYSLCWYEKKGQKIPMMLSMVTQRLTGTEPGPAFSIQNVTIPSCLPFPV